MNRRIDEGQLVQLLRQAGTDIELDRNRIMAIVDRGATAPQTRPLQRPVAQLKQRPRIQLLALPMAAALAVGMVLVFKGGMEPKSEHIKIVNQPASTSTPDPTATSKLGDARSITAPTQTQQPGSAGNAPAADAAPSSTGQQQPTTGNTSVQVAPVPQGSAYHLPLHGSVGWLLVGSAQDGSQPHSQQGGSDLGPAQVMGQGQTVEVGPYDLAWSAGATTTQATQSGTWMTVPGTAQGVPSGIRVPVRLHRLPATITLLTGTVGGGGHVKVSAGSSQVTAELPSCTQPICAAVVTIQLGQQQGTVNDVMIDFSATGADSKVGLAAVELD
jgi:hypothetical protein